MSKIALRGQEGVWMDDGPPVCRRRAAFNKPEVKNCRCFTFSKDGSLFAYCDSATGKVVVTETGGWQPVCELPLPATQSLYISPCKSVVAAWQQYKKSGGQGDANLTLWSVKTGQRVAAFVQQRVDNWQPQWSADEAVCARLGNSEVHFYENNNFETIAHRLHLPKITNYQFATEGKPPYSVAVYAPGTKGQPSFVRLFRYPEFSGLQSSLANKSFYQADRVQMIWNKKGTSLLLLTASDVSAQSYYGDQGLHFLSVSGESCLVPRDKNGPVYCVEWNPNSTEFCVVYGFMPAKATLYSLKCEPVFDFGTGPRNAVYHNPFGNLLCLAGFGNLNGNIEVWEVGGARRRLLQLTVRDTTQLEWSPDSLMLMTCTTAPRLRVSNGYKVWSLAGKLVDEFHSGAAELWNVAWQPVAEGTFQPPNTATLNNARQEVAPPRYVPPALRGKPEAERKSTFHQDDEPDANVRGQQAEPKSKSALKNAKKREAKKNKQQQETAEQRPASSSIPPPSSLPAHSAPAAQSNPEQEKKIRNLQKKLQQIEKLKEKQAAGETLQKNQLDKLKTEEALLEELENLQLQ